MTKHIDSLEATVGTFRRSTFHLQRRIEKGQEEEKDVNIKFLLSCSTHHIYVFSSCSITVEKAMPNIEIVNERGFSNFTLLKRQVQRVVLDTVCNTRIN